MLPTFSKYFFKNRIYIKTASVKTLSTVNQNHINVFKNVIT